MNRAVRAIKRDAPTGIHFYAAAFPSQASHFSSQGNHGVRVWITNSGPVGYVERILDSHFWH